MKISIFCMLTTVCFLETQATFGQPVLRREANDTLKLPLTPPTYGYATTQAFGALTFTDPVAVVTAPGETNRLFVVEQAGIVSMISNLASPTRIIFMDLRPRVTSGGERGLLGLAFHPGFATNRQFFLFYTPTTSSPAGSGLHNRLSRFEAVPGLDRGDPASETVLISQYDEASNHNGGDLHFGPDGYLYVSLGDEGGANDSYNNSQRIDRDFFSAILRLDVDGKPGSLTPNPHPANTNAQGGFNYWVPADNPFVGATAFNGAPVLTSRVRTEFWAVGLRNPWRMSFDSESGLLYVGDVGQGLWEEVDIVERGGNYGWSYREGNAPGPRGNPPPAAQLLPPILTYSHGSGTNQGFSITGGLVYRGNRMPELHGHYIFADYVSGHIWATEYTGTNGVPFWRLTRDSGIAGFGLDPRNGDILMADQDQDTLKRLVRNNVPIGQPLPPTLADTGAFVDLQTLEPAPGVVPYSVNTPFWSDGADKQRWFSLPDTNQVFGFAEIGNWDLPVGAVWVKHFSLELTNGVPESRRRLETRFIVRNLTGVYGITYRWDDNQTNAFLVPEEGLDEEFLVSRNGEVQSQVWRYPSRGECLSCHTPQGGLALSFNTPQLNRNFTYPSGTANQLLALAEAGYLDREPPPTSLLPAMADIADEEASVSLRVRSYLAANCAQCHQPSGGSVGFWDAKFTDPAELTKIVGVPLNDPRMNPDNKVVTPGSIEDSELLHRISFRGPGQMPPMATHVVDTEAVALISGWITNTLQGYVPPAEAYEVWARSHFSDPDLLAANPKNDPDGDGLRNVDEYFYGRNPLENSSRWEIQLGVREGELILSIARVVNRGGDIRLERASSLTGPWTPLQLDRSFFFSPDEGSSELKPGVPTGDQEFWRGLILEP